MDQLEVTVFNPTAFFRISPITAYLIFLIACWALWQKRYAIFPMFALCCNAGIGHASFGVVNFAKVAWVVCFIAGVLALHSWFTASRRRLFAPLRGLPFATSALAALVVVIIAKSAFDTFHLGFEDYRMEAWYFMVFKLIAPTLLLLAALLAQPYRRVVHDFMLGAVLIGGVWLGTGVVAAFLYDPIKEIVSGARRLSLHNTDTINSVAFVPFTMLGCFWFLSRRSSLLPGLLRAISLVGVLGCWAVLILTGTRQFALTCAVMTLLFLIVIGRGGIVAALVGLLLLLVPVALLSNQLKNGALFTRIRDVSESGDARLMIWSDALDALDRSPWTGTGFRNFGQFTRTYDAETGILTEGRDTAHGLFQDIFVEHGVPIGLLFTALIGVLIFRAFRVVFSRDGPYLRVAAVAMCAVPVSYLFSGNLSSSGQVFLTILLFSFGLAEARAMQQASKGALRRMARGRLGDCSTRGTTRSNQMMGQTEDRDSA